MREMLLKTEKQTVNEVSRTPEYYTKIANDAGFYFCLKRGRIDWNKINAIDIDRIIQERDIMTLRANLYNVTNCSLETEYDVRVLDPGFVKLFKLAQLSVDYLTFMEEYTSKQSINITAQLNTALEENEKLKNESMRRNEELKYMKRCLREKENIKKILDQYHKTQYYMNFISQCFKCMYCDKSFLNGTFLDAHLVRRHPKDPDQEVQKQPKNPEQEVQKQPSEDKNETATLFTEIQELKDRLHAAEQLLHKSKEENILYHQMVKQFEKAIEDKLTETSQTNKKQELADLQQILQAEIEKTTTTSPMEIKALHEVTQEQEKKIKYLEELLNAQAENAQKTVKEQLDSQEQEWQHRWQELEQQHVEAVKKVEELTQKLVDHTGVLEGRSDKTSFLAYEARLNQLHQVSLQQENQLQQQSSQIELMKKALIDAMSIQKSKVKFDEGGVKMKVVPATEQQMSATSSSSSSSSLNTNNMPEKFSSFPGSKDSDVNSPVRPVSVYMVKGQVQDKKLDASTVAAKFKKPQEIFEKGRPIQKYVIEKDKEEGIEGVDGEEEEDEEEEEDMDGSEEEEEEDSESSTTSELAKKSIDPDELQQKSKFQGTNRRLKADVSKELQLILDRRLREMGVDPDWSHLPRASLQHKMTTLKHHQHIAAKRYADYFEVRKFLLSKVRQRLITLTGTKILRDNTSRKKTAVVRDARSLQVDSIVNRVKRKASGLNQSEDIGNPRLLAQSTTSQKLPGERSATSKHKLETRAFDDKSVTRQTKHPGTSTKSSLSHYSVPSQSKVRMQPAQWAATVKERNKFTKSEIEPECTVDDESDESSTESSLTTIVSPRQSKEKHSGSTFSATGLTTPQEKGQSQTSQNRILLKDSTVFSARSSGSQKTVHKENSENPRQLSRTNDTGNGPEVADSKKPNSALKTPSSSNHAKKHVVFQDLAVEYSSTSSEKQQGRHSVTWDSSDDEELEPIKKPRGKMPTDIQTAKENESSGSIVAQKSREIQQKISARVGKPIGGVDTLSNLPASAHSAPRDHVEYTQMKQAHSSTMGTKQLPLSEWDIEDLEDFD